MFAYQVTKDLKLAIPNPARDSEQVFKLIDESRNSMQKWLPWVAELQNVEDEIRFLKHVNTNFGTGASLNVVIYFRQQPAGMISFNHINNNRADIGYWLAERFRGRGIMHQAVLAMVDIGFHEYDLNRIEIEAAVGNDGSNYVAQKAGFTLEGTLRENRRLLDGCFHDHNLYAFLRRDWKNR
ncbi:GNAT family N-acetyltransferase [Pediococcus siamensis]|uniref:GNAT family N-acetyltransferase n=1 Tax=Pediococcus siamensis TaxID=381829 RepID=UPI00399F6D41